MQIDKTHIEKELIDGNLELAIKMLLAILKAHDSSYHNDMILQASSYSGLQRDIMRGTINDSNARMTKAKITHAVRHYWSHVKPDWTVEFDMPNSNSVSPSSSSTKEDKKDTGVKTILFLSANPRNTTRLSIDKELREIKESIKISGGSDKFNIEQAEAVGVKEFRRAIDDYNPNIIHFSGHGSADGKIVLQGPNDGSHEINEKVLGDFFEIMINQGLPLECVVLNACYSEIQAKEIVRSVPNVIGMNNKVKDDTAISFATAFYERLSKGKTYKEAFDVGKVNVSMEGYSGADLPVLHHS